MQAALLVILSLALIGAIVILISVYRKLQMLQKPPDNSSFMLLQNQLQDLAKIVDQKMSETHKTMFSSQQEISRTMQEQFGQSTRLIQGITGQSHKIIAEISEKLTSLDKTNQQVIAHILNQ